MLAALPVFQVAGSVGLLPSLHCVSTLAVNWYSSSLYYELRRKLELCIGLCISRRPGDVTNSSGYFVSKGLPKLLRRTDQPLL